MHFSRYVFTSLYEFFDRNICNLYGHGFVRVLIKTTKAFTFCGEYGFSTSRIIAINVIIVYTFININSESKLAASSRCCISIRSSTTYFIFFTICSSIPAINFFASRRRTCFSCCISYKQSSTTDIFIFGGKVCNEAERALKCAALNYSKGSFKFVITGWKCWQEDNIIGTNGIHTNCIVAHNRCRNTAAFFASRPSPF